MANIDFDSIDREQLKAFREGFERDVKEGKFLLSVNVAVILFIGQFYELKPTDLTSSLIGISAILLFAASLAASSVIILFSYGMERSINAFLGKQLSHNLDTAQEWIESAKISRRISGALIISIVCFVIAFVLVFVFLGFNA